MTVSRSTYVSRMLDLINWRTQGGGPQRRYPEVELKPSLLARTDLVLLSSEPYPFKPKHIAELREIIEDPAKPIQLIDGEMVSWYGSRAIRGLSYLADYASESAPGYCRP